MHVASPQDSLDRDNDMLARTRALLGLPPPAAQPKQPLLLQPRADMPEDMEKAPWGASLQGEPECALTAVVARQQHSHTGGEHVQLQSAIAPRSAHSTASVHAQK
jgi:hypothetical protein